MFFGKDKAKGVRSFTQVEEGSGLRHDTALDRIYQAKAQEIQDAGGKTVRFIFDYEMKGNRLLPGPGPESDSWLANGPDIGAILRGLCRDLA